MIRYREWLLPFEVTIMMLASDNWWSPLEIKLSNILPVKWICCLQTSSPEYYQYTAKASVIKLSFWVRWHVMLLMCCRLQELQVSFCDEMTDRGLLEGIGSLQELTSLRLRRGSNLTARALSVFLHRPSVTSIVFLNLSECSNLDDEGLFGIAKRSISLHIYMSKCSGLSWMWSASVFVWLWSKFIILFAFTDACIWKYWQSVGAGL